MIHILINYIAEPGTPIYIALCGYRSENGKEFHDSTGTVMQDKRAVTCEECKG